MMLFLPTCFLCAYIAFAGSAEFDMKAAELVRTAERLEHKVRYFCYKDMFCYQELVRTAERLENNVRQISVFPYIHGVLIVPYDALLI